MEDFIATKGEKELCRRNFQKKMISLVLRMRGIINRKQRLTIPIPYCTRYISTCSDCHHSCKHHRHTYRWVNTAYSRSQFTKRTLANCSASSISSASISCPIAAVNSSNFSVLASSVNTEKENPRHITSLPLLSVRTR